MGWEKENVYGNLFNDLKKNCLCFFYVKRVI